MPGWVVEYLVRVRHGNLAKMGYVPTGYWGGVLLGRLVLVEPSHRFGERRMIAAYGLLCIAFQLIFWIVPNIIADTVVFSVMGFFYGPFFPTVHPQFNLLFRLTCCTGHFSGIQALPETLAELCTQLVVQSVLHTVH